MPATPARRMVRKSTRKKRFAAIALLTAATACMPLVQAAVGDKLVAKIHSIRPDIPVLKVRETPVEDLLAVELDGGTILYGTADGNFLLTGDLIALADDGLVNLTESIRSERRLALLAEVRTEDMIVFAPPGERKAHVSVFTDVDCSYCRKLHMEMPEINALGIEVRYLAYPRAGTNSESYRKIVSAWCANDPRWAITELKQGNKVPQRSCANPVAAQLELGDQVGVKGTPAMVTESGRLIPGYLSAKALAEALDL